MDLKMRYYVVDFKEEIDRFKTAVSYPELPTIDIDVAISQVCMAFEHANITDAMEMISSKMARDDWLIEHCAWNSRDEEEGMRNHIYVSVLTLAQEMFKKLTLSGMFHAMTESYLYRKPINDYTLAFTRLS